MSMTLPAEKLIEFRRLNTGLLVTAILGVIYTVVVYLWALLGDDFVLGLKTVDGIKLITEADLTTTQRWITVGFAGLPDLCWIWGLIEIARLSRRFSRGELLTQGVVHCLGRFGYALGLQGCAEAAVVPLVAGYLQLLGKLPALDGFWSQILSTGALSSWMAAILVILVTRVLRLGIALREDAELTV